MSAPLRAVVFRVGEERYAFPADAVEEALAGVTVTPLPGLVTPGVGVLRHRGGWLPVLDPAPDAAGRGAPLRAAALVVRRGHVRFALAADAVLALRDLATAAGPGGGGDGDPAPGEEMLLLDDLGPVALLRPEDLFPGGIPAGWEDEGMEPRSPTTEPIALVAFRVAGADFAAPVSEVLEVLDYQRPTPVPNAPAFLAGILPVRDAVLPVVDLRARFEAPAREDADTRVLVAALDAGRVGLVVDAVTDVVRVDPGAVSPPPPVFRGLAARFLHGIARAGDRILILLRLDRVLDAEERIALEEADLSGAVAAAGVSPADGAGKGEAGKGGKGADRRAGAGGGPSGRRKRRS